MESGPYHLRASRAARDRGASIQCPMAHGASQGPVLHGCVLDHTCQSLNGYEGQYSPDLKRAGDAVLRHAKSKPPPYPLCLSQHISGKGLDLCS